MLLSPTEADCAYFAGLLDGEGIFGIYGGGGHYKNIMRFASTCREVTDWVAAHFGGYVSEHTPQNEQHEVFYLWRIEDKDGLQAVIPLVLPYLIIKKAHAQLLLKYCLSISSSKGGRGIKLSEEERELRNAYCTIFRDLNSTGRGSSSVKNECVAELYTLDVGLPAARGDY